MNRRATQLAKSLERRRDHGVRKNYNGRVSTVRYDSQRATLVEVHARPMRLWVDADAHEYRGGGGDEGAVSLAFKPSSDRDRRDTAVSAQASSFLTAQGVEYMVRIVRIVTAKPKSGIPRRAVCIVRHHGGAILDIDALRAV